MPTMSIAIADKITLDKVYKIVSEQQPKRYGYRVKIGEPNPNSRVEYIFDAVGMIPAGMNFTTGTFNYGSWADLWFVRGNYPCMVKANGVEDYRLNPNDYTKKASNGAPSDVNNQNYVGNAMSAIPLIWVKRYQENGYQYVVFCENQYDEGYKAYAHTRTDGTVASVVYHAAFKGSLIGGKLRSVAGIYPQHDTNAQQEIEYAKANGVGWMIRTWSLHELIADLLTLLSKTINGQSAFGAGHITGYNPSDTVNFGICQCGTLMNRGQFFGYSTTAEQMKVFHIEGFWGDRWDRIVGLIYLNGTWAAKMSSEGAGYNLTGEGYASAAEGVFHTPDEGFFGWQKDTIQSEFGRLPCGQITGSEVTYECDGLWAYNVATCVVLCGGACASGWACGPRFLSASDAAGVAVWYVGASLSLVGSS